MSVWGSLTLTLRNELEKMKYPASSARDFLPAMRWKTGLCPTREQQHKPGQIQTRRDIFPVQGVRSCSFLDILGRTPWWGSCVQLLLCYAIIFAKSFQEVSAHVIARADFCFGVSQPAEVSALPLTHSHGSFKGWQNKLFIRSMKRSGDFVMQSTAWDCA